MTHTFAVLGNITKITVSFADEGVPLTGETSVLGNEAKALEYLPFFEKDLRNNFADKFPVAETEGGATE